MTTCWDCGTRAGTGLGHTLAAMPVAQELSKSRVDRAGDCLRNWFTSDGSVTNDEAYKAFEVLDQWRALHGAPMQATNMFLRGALRTLGVDGQVKQRHKRHPQIVYKLARQSIRLSQIEDIAGCRIIVHGIADARRVVGYVAASRSRTRIATIDDYVNGPPGPRLGGYRAVHLHAVRDGMKVEVQVRTQLQHDWAEAVEAWDEVFNSDLKHERGRESVSRYFRLLSEHQAYLDRGEQVPSGLVEELQAAARHVQDDPGEAR